MKKTEQKLTAIKVRYASIDDASAWDEYVESYTNGTYAHQWAWREIFINSFGIKPYYFMATIENKIVGILPTALMKSIIFGKFLISLPWLDYGGALANNDEIAGMLIDRAISLSKEKRCRFLEMRSGGIIINGLVNKTDKYSFKLDLTEGTDEVWKSFDAKARNQVRKAEKSGLTVNFGKAELLHDFYKIFARNMRDLGTPVWPKKFFAEILNHFKNDGEIALVRMDKKPIAAGLLIHCFDYSVVPSASANRKYLKYCPNNLLYWEIIKHCLERGSKIFDFGRSSKGSGTYNFKKQWVKEPINQIWQYRLLEIDELPELNPNNPKFKLARSIWRKLPLPIANFLGPKIVTRLP